MTARKRATKPTGQPTGRPPKPDGERLVTTTIRVTEQQRAKLRRIGAQRVRNWIDRAKD